MIIVGGTGGMPPEPIDSRKMRNHNDEDDKFA
jgi:hypothetical protein